MRIALARSAWGLTALAALVAAGARADDEACRQLMARLPIATDAPAPGVQRWSDQTIDALLKQHIVPPLWSRAAERLHEQSGEGSISNAIEVGRNAKGAIGVFENVAGGGRCARGFVLIERKGRLELGAEVDEASAACGVGITLVDTDAGAVPVMVDASGSTDGKHSSVLYSVLSSSWPVAPGRDVECVVKAVYTDALSLDWPEGARLREQLQPIVLAVMQAGDIHGKKDDIARAFASVPSPRPSSQADAKLQELLDGDRLSPTFSQQNWARGNEPEWRNFDAVARRIVVNGQSYVLAVGRSRSLLSESAPSFMLLGWDGSRYVSLVEGTADVQSTFDHAELVPPEAE